MSLSTIPEFNDRVQGIPARIFHSVTDANDFAVALWELDVSCRTLIQNPKKGPVKYAVLYLGPVDEMIMEES